MTFLSRQTPYDVCIVGSGAGGGMAAYTLTKGGQAVSTGTRQIAASYDAPRQEYANLRAQRDAEDRAARELAELVRLAVAQDLLKAKPH